jgi:hypothetical protein
MMNRNDIASSNAKANTGSNYRGCYGHMNINIAPNHVVDPKVFDTLLAREMHELSMQDRVNIQEEIHGVHSLQVPETPEMIQESFQQLQLAIDQLPSKDAYDHAVQNLNSRYVFDPEFRIKFLRAELYDFHKAAIRVTKWLDLLKKYFGDVALTRQIKFVDLTQQERRILLEGNQQILPSRDRSGRLIHFHCDYATPNEGMLSKYVRVCAVKCCIDL